MYPVENMTFDCLFCFKSVFTEKLNICKCNFICCTFHLKSHNCTSVENILYDSNLKSFSLCNEKNSRENFNFLREFATKNFNLKICSHFSFENFSDLDYMEISQERGCEDCKEKKEIWICLHCQKYFCGRQIAKHGIEHQKKTNHSVFINRDSMIWCYSCENRAVIPYLSRKLSFYEDYELKLRASRKIIYEVDKIYPVEKIQPTSRRIINENNICYMNSIVQMLYSLLPLDQIDYDSIIMQFLNENNFDRLFFEFLRILCALKNNDMHNLHNFTIALLNKTSLFGNNEQHDANEFYFYLIDFLENIFKTFTKFNLLSVLKIKYTFHLKCECGFEKNETYSGYSLNIEMGEVSNTETLFLQRCMKCERVVDCTYDFKYIPKYLIVNINRYRFNMRTYSVEKIEERIRSEDICIGERVLRKKGAILHYGNPTSGHYMYQEGTIIYSDDMQYKCEEGLMEYAYMIVYE